MHRPIYISISFDAFWAPKKSFDSRFDIRLWEIPPRSHHNFYESKFFSLFQKCKSECCICSYIHTCMRPRAYMGHTYAKAPRNINRLRLPHPKPAWLFPDKHGFRPSERRKGRCRLKNGESE
jgi:hypothetical protein